MTPRDPHRFVRAIRDAEVVRMDPDHWSLERSDVLPADTEWRVANPAHHAPGIVILLGDNAAYGMTLDLFARNFEDVLTI